MAEITTDSFVLAVKPYNDGIVVSMNKKVVYYGLVKSVCNILLKSITTIK